MGNHSSRKIVAQKTNSKKRGSNRGPDPSVTTLLMLCARAGGRCEFRGCNRVLFRDEITLNEFNDTNVAHIVASSPNGPRGDATRSHQLSNKIENLMLVCLEHHKMIDDKNLVALYSEECLLKMKRDHECAMELAGDALNFDSSHILLFSSPIKGIQDTTISKNQAVSAMLSTKRPAKAEPDSIRIQCDLDYDDAAYWTTVDVSLRKKFLERVANITQQNAEAHFSVFPLAPIPLIMKLGYLMGDKVRADIYQKRRYPDTWEWQEKSSGSDFYCMKEDALSDGDEVGLVVSLSASKSAEDKASFASAVGAKVIYEIKASKPDVDCISTLDDLSRFWHVYQKTIDVICSENPGCKDICVLPAVPVSAAFEMGRRYMPGIYPRMRIFDFNNGFRETLTIGE
jgi:hypothetical protein